MFSTSTVADQVLVVRRPLALARSEHPGESEMSDAALFILVFGGLFVLRGVAATVVFLWILPDGIRCPQCDAETMRVEPSRLMRWLSGFRSSWCLSCGWHGVHRITRSSSRVPAPIAPQAPPLSPPTAPR